MARTLPSGTDSHADAGGGLWKARPEVRLWAQNGPPEPRPDHYRGVVLTLDQVLTFGLAALVLIAIPGPSVVFVVGRALAYGRGVALASVAGNSLGLLTIVVLVAFGLGVVVQESIVVFQVLKLAGAAYLVYLGIEAVRRRKEFLAPDADTTTGRPMTWRRAIRQGYVVGVSNPKAYMILAAVLPQFVDRGAGHVQLQLLLLGLLAFAIGMVSDSTWAIIASQLRSWFMRSPRRGEAMGTVGGLSMIGLGVGLAVTGEAGR
jgi:threonine/homoserine/homoserine lactone efflux protein